MSLQGGILKWTNLKRSPVVSSGGGLRYGKWEDLYSEVQCIMANDHMGTHVDRLTDGQTDTYETITFATPLAGSKNVSYTVVTEDCKRCKWTSGIHVIGWNISKIKGCQNSTELFSHKTNTISCRQSVYFSLNVKHRFIRNHSSPDLTCKPVNEVYPSAM